MTEPMEEMRLKAGYLAQGLVLQLLLAEHFRQQADTPLAIARLRAIAAHAGRNMAVPELDPALSDFVAAEIEAQATALVDRAAALARNGSPDPGPRPSRPS